MPKLLLHLLYDKKKKRWGNTFFIMIHGDPDSLTQLLEPKNIEMFHYLWN